MKAWMIIAVATGLLANSAVARTFSGKLELVPPGCEKQLKCTVKNEFGFIDSNGEGWQARAGLETDGATIPSWAQPFVGGQFESEFIQAAVIHDHYCERHVRSWRKTHWVFYDALLASNVSEAKALLMYFAVYLGGPKWTKLVEGKPCSTGRNCIQRIANQQWPQNTIKTSGEQEGASYLFRPAQYDDPAFSEHLREAEKFIESRKGQVTLSDLEKRAESIKIGDFFFLQDDELILVPPPGEIDR
jgi:hypothetical protein